jgi:phage terminase small subunit
MEGQNLANFLQQNQLISAQDAGFIAQSAPQVASGYANQLAINDYIARQQQDMLRQRAREQMIYERELARRDELAASRLSEAEQVALLQMGGQPLYTEEQLTAVAKEWDEASDTQKAIWAKSGINSAEQLFQRTVLQAPQMPQG